VLQTLSTTILYRLSMGGNSRQIGLYR